MSTPHIDEALSELEVLRTLTDEQLLAKYSPCFNFEKDFRDAIESGRIKLSAKTLKGEEEDEDESEITSAPLSVEEATKRILEKKRVKEEAKKSKKKKDEDALKKMLLEDEQLLKGL